MLVNWPSLIKIHKAGLSQLRKEVSCMKDIWKENQRLLLPFRIQKTAVKQE